MTTGRRETFARIPPLPPLQQNLLKAHFTGFPSVSRNTMNTKRGLGQRTTAKHHNLAAYARPVRQRRSMLRNSGFQTKGWEQDLKLGAKW
jgi:hypothetical protein